MNAKIKAILESYVRSFVVAAGVAYSDGFRGIEEILIAIAGPAIRAANPKDPAFGLMADAVDMELKSLAKKSASKKKTKQRDSVSGCWRSAAHGQATMCKQCGNCARECQRTIDDAVDAILDESFLRATTLNVRFT